MRDLLSRFLAGRYGPDYLGIAIFILAVVFRIVGGIFGFSFINLLAAFMMILALYRMLSRNIARRRAENDRFIAIFWPIKQKIKLKIEQFKNRKEYKFFRCPACGNNLRVPRGKGRIRITCPKCGERFEKKT